MAIALDGYVHYAKEFGGSTTVVLPNLTTTQSGDIITVHIYCAYDVHAVSVTGSTLGSFTYIGGSSNSGAGNGGGDESIQVWACYAASSLSNEVITVEQSNAYDFRYDVAAWSGTNQTSLTGAFETFIGNQNGGFSGTLPQNYTTTHVNTVVVGFAHLGFNGNASTAGNSFSFVGTPSDNVFTSYKVLTSTSTQTISIDLNDYADCMVGFAIIEVAGGGGGTDNLTASNLTNTAPVLGAPTIDGLKTLSASGLTNTAPVLGAPATAKGAPFWRYIGVSNSVQVTGTSHALVTTGISEALLPGDLLIASIASRIASTTAVTLPSGGEWTLVEDELTNNTTAASTNSVASGTMAFAIRGASDPNFTFTHPTSPSVALGRLTVYRPVNGVAGKDTQSSGTTATNTTSISTTGLTTALNEELIVRMVANARAAAVSAFNAATNPNTSSGTNSVQTANPIAGTWQERQDSNTATGADVGLSIADAVRASAGATGNFTVTSATAGSHAQIAGAFYFRVTPAAGNLTNSAPVLDAPTLSVNSSSTDNLTAAVLTNTAPVLGPATIKQVHVLNGSLTNTAPVLGPASLLIKYLLTSSALTNTSPTIGTSTLVRNATTLNPNDKDSGATLSSGNLVLTSGTPASGARSTSSKYTGKNSFRVTGDFRALTSGAGVSLLGAPTDGSNANTFILVYEFTYGGWVLVNNSTLVATDGVTTAPTGTDTVNVHIDSTNNLAYFTANGNNLFGGNPAAGTGGISIMTGPHYALAAATNSSVTTNFNPTSLPSGYSAWDQGIGNVDSLTASSFANTSAVLGSPAIGQKHVLVGGFTNTAPVLGPAQAGYNLAASNLTNTAPVLGPADIKQVHALGAAALTNTAPVLGPATIGIIGSTIAAPLTNTSPDLGTATIKQIHALGAAALTNTAPALGAPALAKVLTASVLTNTAPSLGAPALFKTLTAAALTNTAPNLGTVTAIPTTTLNPLDKDVTVDLSGSNFSMAINAGNRIGGARSIHSWSTGKHAFAITTMFDYAYGGGGITLVGANRVLTDTRGVGIFYWDQAGWIAYTGDTITQTDNTTTPPTDPVIDTVIYYVDSSANKLYAYSTNAGAFIFGADPVAGTGGIDIPAGPHFALAAIDNLMGTWPLTVNFNPSNLASGYSPWSVGDGQVTNALLTAAPINANAASPAPVLGAPSLGVSGVMSAATLINTAPVLGTAIIGQKHTLGAATLTNTAPVLGPASIKQVHVLGAAALTNTAPVLPAVNYAGAGSMLPANLANTSPALGPATIGQKHVLGAAALTNTAPILGPATVVYNLVSAGLTNTAPAFGSAVIKQGHALSGALTNSSPVLGAPVLGQKHVLGAAGLANSAPDVPSIPLGVVGVIACQPLTNTAPVLGPAQIAQKHVLGASGLSNSAPVLGSPVFVSNVSLSPAPLANSAPIIGVPAFGQKHVLTGSGLTNTAPGLPGPQMIPGGIMAAFNLANTAPLLGLPVFRERYTLIAGGLTNTNPVLGPVQLPARLTAANLRNGVPTIPSGRLNPRYWTKPVSLQGRLNGPTQLKGDIDSSVNLEGGW